MENLESNTAIENSSMSNSKINSYLLESAKWGKFLAIVGYIIMGLIVLIALVMAFGLSQLSRFSGTRFPVGYLGLVYILIAGAYYFPVTYLYKFAVQIKRALESGDEGLYTSGFQNLKSLFKFMGIFTIVILSLYGIILVIAVPLALFFK